MATCEVCSKVYEAKRTDSRTCGGPCRAKAARLSARAVTDKLSARADPRMAIPGYGTPACQCKMCQGRKSASVQSTTICELNHGPYMTAQQLKNNGYKRNRVALPGDLDYVGVATAVLAQQ